MFTRLLAVRRRARVHRVVATSIFLVLGFHVGVWAVQLAGLSSALRLDPGPLGTALTVASACGIVTLFVGGRLSDRLGRRPVLLLGFGGTSVAFALLSQVHHLAPLFVVLALYGLFVSFIDLGANTVGADFERQHEVRAMTGLHAGFSLGAMVGALLSALVLWSGAGFRAVYLGLAGLLAVAALASTLVPLPEPAPEEPSATSSGVWRIPAVLFAIVLVTVTFFGDGGLESFLAVYLQRILSSGTLLTGLGVAGYHCASLIGRLLAGRALNRWGERYVVSVAGIVAASGLVIAVSAGRAVVAIAGLLLVGFAIAPVVPSALSLAARSAPGRSGRAVATTTAAGYSSFIVSPVVVGWVSDATTLRTGLAVLVATALGIAVLGARWPRGDRATPG